MDEQQRPPGTHRLVLPTGDAFNVSMSVAFPADIDTLKASAVALLMTLLESDITIDGLRINPAWLTPVASLEGTTPSAVAEAQRQARMIDDAIMRAYPPNVTATVHIQGLVSASDAVRWLRALRLRAEVDPRPQRTTQLALIKG